MAVENDKFQNKGGSILELWDDGRLIFSIKLSLPFGSKNVVYFTNGNIPLKSFFPKNVRVRDLEIQESSCDYSVRW